MGLVVQLPCEPGRFLSLVRTSRYNLSSVVAIFAGSGPAPSLAGHSERSLELQVCKWEFIISLSRDLGERGLHPRIHKGVMAGIGNV